MKAKLKRLPVYRSALGDSSNDGISGKESHIYLIELDGLIPSQIPLEAVFRAEQRGPKYFALIPFVSPVKMCGPMFGGNLAMDEDSGRIYKIHDRFETPELNALLSS